MKLNLVPSLIALALSCLIAYSFYAFSPALTDKFYWIVSISFVITIITLFGAMGVNFENGRTTTVIRTLSGTFFFIGLIVLILLNIFSAGIPVLIISSGIILLTFILIAYSIAKSKH